jgi:hypothetical protein
VIVTEDNLGENFLCICKEVGECEKAGACLENPNGFSVEEEIEIDAPPIVLEINYGDKLISRN